MKSAMDDVHFHLAAIAWQPLLAMATFVAPSTHSWEPPHSVACPRQLNCRSAVLGFTWVEECCGLFIESPTAPKSLRKLVWGGSLAG